MHLVVKDGTMIKNSLDLVALGPVIPVIVLQRVEHAVPMARALVAGGVRVLEVTLRTPVALACMEAVSYTHLTLPTIYSV